MTKAMICIMCPLGCKMEVQFEGQKINQLQGNECKKGFKYAKQEISFPGRILTTTIKTENSLIPLLPVRSDKEIPKEKLIECMIEIFKYTITGSINVGEIVIPNIIGLDANIIASRTLS